MASGSDRDVFMDFVEQCAGLARLGTARPEREALDWLEPWQQRVLVYWWSHNHNHPSDPLDEDRLELVWKMYSLRPA